VRTPALVTLAVTALAPSAGRAWDVQIDSETIGQGYQVLAGDGALISRRRLDQYLGLNVYNLGPKDSSGVPLPKNQFYFTSSLRLEFDFGNYPPPGGRLGARDVAGNAGELSTNRFELLYAYFGGRDVFGFVDFKLGRQIDYDLFEFLSYDGLSVEVKTPYYIAASLYGGLLVNGFLPIDSPIFRPDGTAPGGIDIHDSDAKAVLGVGLRAFGFRDLDAHFSYRRIFAPGSDAGGATCPTPFVDLAIAERCTGATDGTTEEKLGFWARGRILNGLIVPWFGIRYDLLNSAVDVIQTGARFQLGPRHALQLEYYYSYPTFDGDSIWNLFARTRFDDIRLGYDLRLGRLKGWTRLFLRFFHDLDETTSSQTIRFKSPGGALDGGGDAGARFDFRRGYLRADVYLDMGYGGQHIGADVATRWNVWKEMISLEGRLTYAHFEDGLRPEVPSNDSIGFQVGGRVAFARGILVHLILEDNINRLYSSQLRFYAVVDVSVLLGRRGFGMSTPRGIGPGMGQFGSGYGMGMGY
jgi:hypothetical protein